MILGIDTATRRLSIALLDDEEVLAEHSWLTANQHSKELSPAIDRMLHQLEVAPRDLTAVGVAKGPGSFTGVRIGMGVAKGLAMALSIPLIGVLTLDVIAAATPGAEEPLVAIVQAGRGRIIAKTYHWQSDGWMADGAPTLTTWETLLDTVQVPTILNGEITGREHLQADQTYVRLLPPEMRLRRASTLARIAQQRLRNGETSSSTAVMPVYLK